MQSTGGLINDLIILGIFIYMILLIHGKVKLSAEKQDKFDGIMNSRGKLLKFLVYSGTGIFIALILIGVLRHT